MGHILCETGGIFKYDLYSIRQNYAVSLFALVIYWHCYGLFHCCLNIAACRHCLMVLFQINLD